MERLSFLRCGPCLPCANSVSTRQTAISDTRSVADDPNPIAKCKLQLKSCLTRTIPMRTLSLLLVSTFTATLPAFSQSLIVSPTALTFTGTVSGSSPATQFLSVQSSGFAVSFTASNSFVSWLSVSPTFGATPSTVSVAVNTFGLTVGTYTSFVTIQSGFSSITVPVTLTITTGTGIGSASAFPANLTFTHTPGSPAPATQSVTITTNPSGVVYSTAAFTTTGGNWLSVLPLAALTPSNLTVSVNPTGLAVGTYNGQVTVFPNAAEPLSIPVTLNVTNVAPTTASRFVAITPCRVVDTRFSSGVFGAPSLGGSTTRDFPISSGACGIPTNASAYSVNFTVVPFGPLSFLTAWPTGQSQPLVSTLNAFDGGITSNAAIVPAGNSGSISVFVTNPTDVIIDVNGYFINNSSALALYTVAPCRLVDTRNPISLFGGPQLFAGQTRDFNVASGGCGIPFSAQAFSLNATVVPPGPLSFLTLFPSSTARPNVSTLNATDGAVKANAAIVPGLSSGSVSAYVTDRTDLVLDVNAYFAPPGSPNGLSFYPVTPCRVVDTRIATSLFSSGPVAGGSSRDFAVQASTCGIPSTAAAYSFNVTVVPVNALSFLTLYPAGSTRPFVSTLNSFAGKTLANAAIVPAGTSGSVSVFASDTTHVILDINGYFAP